MEGIAAEELPPEARVSYGGLSRTYQETTGSLYMIFGFALLIVFLVLAAQFESFIHPLVIMLSVPLAITGALGTMMLSGLSINVYTQIGMIMLIGLVRQERHPHRRVRQPAARRRRGRAERGARGRHHPAPADPDDDHRHRVWRHAAGILERRRGPRRARPSASSSSAA